MVAQLNITEAEKQAETLAPGAPADNRNQENVKDKKKMSKESMTSEKGSTKGGKNQKQNNLHKKEHQKNTPEMNKQQSHSHGSNKAPRVDLTEKEQPQIQTTLAQTVQKDDRTNKSKGEGKLASGSKKSGSEKGSTKEARVGSQPKTKTPTSSNTLRKEFTTSSGESNSKGRKIIFSPKQVNGKSLPENAQPSPTIPMECTAGEDEVAMAVDLC
ncbi:unnamed protein product [Linum trigynum]|uniref:Uncharacterized protein n=1 Tax=Linum trigynum TaxID=586398 RepID=A0AAV2DUE5_9ROSI